MRRGSPEEDTAFLDCLFESETKDRIAAVARQLSH